MKGIGLVLAVVGGFLMDHAYQASRTFVARFNQAVGGAPTDSGGVVFALKGRHRTARGIAPGDETRRKISALKGRNLIAVQQRELSRPFRAEVLGASGNPGRCPGLSCVALSGRRRTRNGDNAGIHWRTLGTGN